MRFYNECIRAAEQVGKMMTEEERVLFIECEYQQLYTYDPTIGVWITDALLPHNPYLNNALVAMGCQSPYDMCLFLLEFIQQYWRLKQAQML